MRTPTDALRSLARYVASALGPDWEVRLSTEKGAFQRPSARVAQVPNIQMITDRWWSTKFIASYQITLYPSAGVEADGSQLEALRVTDLIWVAFAGPGVGNPTIRPPRDSTRGRPYRIPLYDYAGVPLDGPQASVGEGDRNPRDFLHMEAPPEVNPVNDPGDELLYSVVVNIRMSWLRNAAVPSAAATTGRVNVGVGDING